LRDVASDEWWAGVTPPMLETARRQLRSIVGLLDRKKRPPIYSDFEDTLGEVTEVAMPTLATFTDTERFRAKVYDFLVRQPDNLALQKLKKAQPLTRTDLDSLRQLLITSGVAEPADLHRATENAHGFGQFIRSLVGMDRQAATTAFAQFLDGKTATANQIQFIQLIVDRFTQDGSMAPGMLFEPPSQTTLRGGSRHSSTTTKLAGSSPSSTSSTTPPTPAEPPSRTNPASATAPRRRVRRIARRPA
jgi:type I restriction enzyme R subunit